jgi:hypothetical protein
VYVRALGTLHFDGRLRPGFYLISYWDFFDRRLGWPVLANSCKHHVAASRDVVLIPDFEVLADMGFGKWFGQVDAARSTWGWKDKLPVVFWCAVWRGGGLDSRLWFAPDSHLWLAPGAGAAPAPAKGARPRRGRASWTMREHSACCGGWFRRTQGSHARRNPRSPARASLPMPSRLRATRLGRL